MPARHKGAGVVWRWGGLSDSRDGPWHWRKKSKPLGKVMFQPYFSLNLQFKKVLLFSGIPCKIASCLIILLGEARFQWVVTNPPSPAPTLRIYEALSLGKAFVKDWRGGWKGPFTLSWLLCTWGHKLSPGPWPSLVSSPVEAVVTTGRGQPGPADLTLKKKGDRCIFWVSSLTAKEQSQVCFNAVNKGLGRCWLGREYRNFLFGSLFWVDVYCLDF